MIAVACDHAAYELKNEIIAHLKERGFDVKDFGCHSAESVDYPDYALPAALAVQSGECEKGILICGTGIGMSMVANKVKGIRCAHCCDEFSAQATRQHNDANMMALGARIISTELAVKLADIFLDTPFSGEARHAKRIEKISQVEDKFFK